MKKSFLYIAFTLVLHPFIVNGQIIVVEPKNNPFFIIQNIVDGDTIVVDSIPSGLIGNTEKVIAQQEYIYKYNSGYGYGFKNSFGEFFILQKFSIVDEKLKRFSESTIFSYEHKKLFDAGMEVEFCDNGIKFKLPSKFSGEIVLPFEFYINQKQLDKFLKFLTKSIDKF